MYLGRSLSENNGGYLYNLAPGELVNQGAEGGRRYAFIDLQRADEPSINSTYGLFVDAGGTRCYLSGRDTALPAGQQTVIARYDLPAPNENRISTSGDAGSQSAVYVGRNGFFQVWGQDINVGNILFRPDGLRMYGSTGTDLHQFTLDTAWDTSTLSFDGTNTSGIGLSFYIEPTGNCLYSSFSSQSQIRQYVLPSPWDVLGVDATDEVSRKTLGGQDYVNLNGIYATNDRIFVLSDKFANPDYLLNQYNYPGTDYSP
jgi:hypothetical protein